MTKINQTQKNDLILIFASILFLFLGGFLVFQFSYFLPDVPRPPQIIGSANLTIDFGNGVKRVFSGDIVINENLLDVLTQSSVAGGFSYKLNKNGDLVSINTLISGRKKSWRWYLNGEKVDKKPSKITVKPNDNILIKYE